MGRGRKCVPPPDRDGIWYTHTGADGSDAGTKRSELTTTGKMLSDPFTDTALSRPPPPPHKFCKKAQTIYRTANPFSFYDNRNVIQSCGEYLGDGGTAVNRTLGRKMLLPLHTRLTHTEADFLAHHCRNPTLYSYNTVCANTYTGAPATTTTPTTRRFPRDRRKPLTGLVPLSTSTAVWFPDTPRRSVGSLQASTQVLALSQQPFPKHSDWKYSFKGLSRSYPVMH